MRPTNGTPEITKSAVKVPKGIRLVMCDVDCGSQTPGMVKQLLGWRDKEPEEGRHVVAATFIARTKPSRAELKRLAESGGDDGDGDDKGADSKYAGLGRCIADIRTLIRDMSRLSGVPVEPEEQTKLLDACTEVEGVIGGVVPGAGGFDAIALLVQDEHGEEAFAKLRRRLAEWNRSNRPPENAAAATDADAAAVFGIWVRSRVHAAGARGDGRCSRRGFICVRVMVALKNPS